VVVSVIDEKPLPGKEIPERLADGLRTRGLTVETGSIQAGDRLIGAALQEHSLKIGGKLLVRWIWSLTGRDFVLGGATEGVLTGLLIPVLASH